MTQEKKARNKRRRNVTAHDRAMGTPEVKEIFNALQLNWDSLSLQQRGEQIQKLIDFKCSIRGLGRDLGQPEANIRRHLAQANPLDRGNDWEEVLRNIAKESRKEPVTENHATVPCIPPKYPAEQGPGRAIEQKHLALDRSQSPRAQETKKITLPSPRKEPEIPSVNNAVGVRKDRAGEDTPKTFIRDRYMLNRGSMPPELMRSMFESSESFKRRRDWNARSMKRQGRPLPPTD